MITTHFRSQVSTTKTEREAQIVKINMILAIYAFLQNYIKFPPCRIPTDESAINIKRAAKRLREMWGLGSGLIQHLLSHVENNGIIATSLSTGNHKVDTYSINTYFDGEPIFVIALGNDKSSATRRNFNIAHELGHLVLNHYEDGESKQREEEANEFAAEFLLPADEFIRDLIRPKSLESYVELKRKWKVFHISNYN